MNDRHVRALIYRVTHPDRVSFEEAEPLAFETSQFAVKVDKGSARFVLKEHYSDVKAARTAIEPFIRMWEMWEALSPASSDFRLVFEAPEVVDRNPPPGNYGVSGVSAVRMSAHGTLSRAFRWYPEPPSEGAVSNAEVEVMVYRHWLYQQGRDNLAAMAYFCLTVLENSTGYQKRKRERAAEKYNVDLDVLNRLGELTSTRGGRGARKRDGVDHNFTPAERMWMETTVNRVIRRAADLATDPDPELPRLTMAKLPHLPTN